MDHLNEDKRRPDRNRLDDDRVRRLEAPLRRNRRRTGRRRGKQRLVLPTLVAAGVLAGRQTLRMKGYNQGQQYHRHRCA